MLGKKAVIFRVHHGLGGSTLGLVPYVEVLRERGFMVSVYSRKSDRGSAMLGKYGAKHRTLRFPLSLNVTAMEEFHSLFHRLVKNLKDLVKIVIGFLVALVVIKREKAEFVLVGDFSMLPVILAARMLQIRTLVLIQTDFSRGRLKRFVVQRILDQSDGIVGITDLHLAQISERFRRNDRKHCFVLPNSVLPFDETASFDTFYRCLEVRTPHMVLFVGGMSRLKGSLEFCSIAATILRQRDDVTFVLAGPMHKSVSTVYSGGSEESERGIADEILRIKEKCDLNDRIKIIGETEFILPLLKGSRFLLAPSNYSHFLRPVIEAWSVKRPVVITDDQHGRQLVENESDGYLVERGNIPAFVERSILLLENEPLRTQMGMNGYRKYIRTYEYTAVRERIRTAVDVTLSSPRSFAEVKGSA